MKIVFASNFYNHHQAYLSRALYSLAGGNYHFVSTIEIPDEQKKIGYKDIGEDILIQYGESDEAAKKAQELIDSADVVIIGSAPDKLIKNRKKAGKLIFRYSERPFKKGDALWKRLPRFIKWHTMNPFGKPIYMLCSSAYTSADYGKYGLFKNKSYKWGYFPEAKDYDVDLLMAEKDPARIMWCGRFIDWKHPDDALAVAERLKADGYRFSLEFIGTGIMESELSARVIEKELEDCVSFLGPMEPDRVREHMEKAGIYLFTSDKQEGWGAVLNESMNSGCAVVASHAIGSVPYMLEDGKNGLIYKSGDVDMLYKKVKQLLDSPDDQKRLGRAAYVTVTEKWNAELAAKRFVELAQRILEGEKSPELYDNGPCSRAKKIKDDWF